MYRRMPCAVAGCKESAFSGSPLCRFHLPQPEEAVKAIVSAISEDHNAINIDFSDMSLSLADFSRTRFVGCRFRKASLSHTMFTGASFRLCFFDTAIIDSCDFSGVDMDFCSFGDVDIFDCSFENSELIHVSFNGSRIRESTFSSSNLYDSRFILSEIENSRFDDCDFKRVYFMPIKSESVSTTGSNITEAVKDMEHLYL